MSKKIFVEIFGFWWWMVLKSLLYNIASVLRLTFWLHGLWDLSSGTRDPTPTPTLEGEVWTTGLPSKSLKNMIVWFFSKGDYSLIKILKEEGENLGFTKAGKVSES